MNSEFQFEDRTSSRRSKHEGESSSSLCDRLSRTRDFSQRQLPTDQDYAVSTREYQTDQSSLLPAPAAAGPVLEQRQKQRQQQKPPHRCAEVDGSLHIRESLINSYSTLSIPSKAKAPSDFAGFMYGLNPVPFKASTCSEVPSASSGTRDARSEFLDKTHAALFRRGDYRRCAYCNRCKFPPHCETRCAPEFHTMPEPEEDLVARGEEPSGKVSPPGE
jgi:hypothetical protein